MSLAMLCCLAAMNACIPGEPLPKELQGLVGEWVTDFPEEGVINNMTYDHVIEHYAFFENNTGYYECFHMNGDLLVGSEYLRGEEESSFQYGLIAPGYVGLYHSKDDYWYLRFNNGVLRDPDKTEYTRASDEMVAQMTAWANLLTPGWLGEKLIGKWMIADVEGKPAPTNRKTVLTFVSDTKAFMSRSFDKPDKEGITPDKKPDIEPGQRPKPDKKPGKRGWDDYEEFDVTIQGNLITLDRVEQGHHNNSSTYLILDISDAAFVCEFSLPKRSGGPEGKEGDKEGKTQLQRFEKIEADYEQTAIGLWEGKVTSADDEYTDGKLHRWELKEDGTYIYFRQEEETGAWVDDVNEFADYFIDGTLLCMRWKNEGEGQKENREWWEIASIEDGVMKWKALRQREDGSTYTATFEMKAVEVPSQAEIEEMIIGKWMSADYDGHPELTNNKSVITFLSTTEALYSTSRVDYTQSAGKWSDHLEYMVEIEGNKVNLIAAPDEHIMLVNELTIYSITDSEMDVTFKHTTLRDGEVIGSDAKEHSMRWERVTEDYSQAILGTWQGLTNGSSGYPAGELYRMEYKTDGTYLFWLKVGEEWQLFDDEFSDYFVDGILLCTRWKNSGEGTVENREWWEITSIEDGVMKWKGLRADEDGTTHIATFELTQVK
jgi:hypothetical protein